TLYPNPADQEVTISFSGDEINDKTQVELIDQHGKLVKRWTGNMKIHGRSIRLSTVDLPGGVYYIIVKGDADQPAVRKLVIQH
ncbi:MAG: T9SS type A sorting domain-containing protein, partial [Chitinophagaceae bacterium]